MKQKKVSNVQIDLCEICHGVWLDCGELNALAGIDPVEKDPLWAIEIALKQFQNYVSSKSRK